MHYQTVGFECSRCHTPKSWIVENINEIHQMSRFPLVGAHFTADCFQCHPSASLLRFEPLGIECIDCHQEDYLAATNPNHSENGFSTDCIECHSIDAFSWSGAGFNHNIFPIYSGSHGGSWNNCSDCHINQSNYSIFSCIGCHEHNQADMDDEHEGINGYQYNSIACLECHPTGEEEGSFNHNSTNFPLTGAHVETDCSACHPDFYAGTSTICFDCHIQDFNQSTNPNHNAIGIALTCEDCHTTNPGWTPASFEIHDEYYPLTGAHLTMPSCFDCHQDNYTSTPNLCADCHTGVYNQTTNPNHNAIGISTECEECHSTNPNWSPASFSIHNNYYVLQGAHAIIANDCFACHEGNYNITPNTCYGCHTGDYNQTNDPPHQTAQFPTDCELCHSQTAWEPSTFDHDGQYFPIYSGEHAGEWNQCSDCHNNPGNYAIFDCLSCHPQGEMDDEHEDVSGYIYNSIACLECHPDGSAASKKFKIR
jgi:hypothetical protein